MQTLLGNWTQDPMCTYVPDTVQTSKVSMGPPSSWFNFSSPSCSQTELLQVCSLDSFPTQPPLSSTQLVILKAEWRLISELE